MLDSPPDGAAPAPKLPRPGLTRFLFLRAAKLRVVMKIAIRRKITTIAGDVFKFLCCWSSKFPVTDGVSSCTELHGHRCYLRVCGFASHCRDQVQGRMTRNLSWKLDVRGPALGVQSSKVSHPRVDEKDLSLGSMQTADLKIVHFRKFIKMKQW